MKTNKIIMPQTTSEAISFAEEQLNDGREVILDFGKRVNVKELDHVFTYFTGNYEVDVTMRHAELKEIVEAGLIGGVIGAGTGALAAFLLGGPVGILTGIGALIGVAAGVASVTLNITVYKYRGHTLMKIKPE